MAQDEKGVQYVTADRAASILNISVQRVYQLLRDELLKGEKKRDRWFITMQSIQKEKEFREMLARAEGEESR